MILNSGLDNVAKYTNGVVSNIHSAYGNFIRHCAVGTGSEEPVVTQINLQAETHRTDSPGGFPFSTVFTRDSQADKLRITFLKTWVFNFAGSFNLNEMGWVPVSSGGQFTIRELFRDIGGNSITLSVQDGMQLQITLTMLIELPWIDVSESFTITNLGTVDGRGVFTASSDSNVNTTMSIWWPGSTTTEYLHVITSSNPSILRDQVVATNGPNGAAAIGVRSTYVDGNYFRDQVFKYTTAQGNREHFGWVLSNSAALGGSIGLGYKFVNQTPTSVTKASSHELEITFRTNWARA